VTTAAPGQKIIFVALYDNAGAEPVMLEWGENQ
jgi:hypothetical protein